MQKLSRPLAPLGSNSGPLWTPIEAKYRFNHHVQWQCPPPVGADTRLTSVTKLCCHGAPHCCSNVCRVEDNEWSIASQFQRKPFDRSGASGHEELPHGSGTGKGELMDKLTVYQPVPHHGGVATACREDVEDTRREPCLLSELEGGRGGGRGKANSTVLKQQIA